MKNQKTLVYVSILILTAVFSFSLGSKVEKKQALNDLYKTKTITQLPVQINIDEVLRGNLVSFTGGSWTIKNGKDTLTVTQQVSTQKIAYFLTNRKTNATSLSKATDLKVGDYINMSMQY